MDNLSRLVEIGDSFDKLGHTDLANKVDRILKLAANVNFNHEYDFDRPFDKEEEQRLIALEYTAVYKMLLQAIPKIDYLLPFEKILVDTLEHAQLVITAKMQDKTAAFNYPNLKERMAYINIIKTKLEFWSKQKVAKSRVVTERQLLLAPLKGMIRRLENLYEDDEALEAIEGELKIVVNVFENIFDQTIGEIADMSFPKS